MPGTREDDFIKWVHDHSDVLYNFAMQRCMDTELAKDLVQETFLAAWRNKEQYKGEASVKNWLFVILKNKLTDHFRKAANKKGVELVLSEHEDHRYFDADDHWEANAYPRAWEGQAQHLVESKEFYKALGNCCKKLRDIQQAVFTMKYVDGKESEQICKELEIAASNYWVILHRAKVQLRACLQKNWIDQ